MVSQFYVEYSLWTQDLTGVINIQKVNHFQVKQFYIGS